ncbi:MULTISPECIES: NUDIX domain-containing protein [Thioalkalivibrio]|uniref:NUDIX hydrolase n=1 Tax=Thioalkalivibrio halophilus TaxID=252474 RepID=A0A1V3A0T3_9GAMM|nr:MULTISPECIES: NUDIX domain-containing protein [Thioalkalivibrio]OOC10926.1 NUDIX hydrolase [Thioalkalivibrio halophilus]
MNERLRCHITVAAVIEDRGRFLFVEEEDAGLRVLNQPAGHLDPDEDLIAAVRREVREETALEFAPQHSLGCDLLRLADGAVILRVAFTGTVSTPAQPIRRDPAILATHWLDAATALNGHRLRSPLVARSLRRWESGLRLPLESAGELVDNVRPAPARPEE